MSAELVTKSDAPWTPLLVDPDAVQVAGTVLCEPVRVLVDTGSAATIVDSAFIKRVSLSPSGSRSVRGDIGSVTLSEGRELTIESGGQRLEVARYVVTDFRPIFGADASAPDVILGLDALQDVVLEIDFAARRLAFWPRGTFTPSPRAKAQPVAKSARGQLYISIALEQHDPVAAAIDLGSSNPLTVSPALAEAQGLLQGRPVSSAASGGIDGISISRTISVATLLIGRTVLKDVPCEVLAKTDPSLAPAKIGLPVLERYRFALDVAGGALWLQAAPGLVSTPFRRDLSGLGLAVERDRLRVIHVARGGPAAEAGWREGESIVAVDGAPIQSDYAAGALAGWRFGPPGKTVVLSLADGSKRTLVLRRYY